MWIDVTWGAGGSTSETTLSLCETAMDVTGLDVLMHLTCTNVTIDTTRQMRPMWIDVTWGAGGSTADTTLSLCETAMDVTGLDVLMHLTCTNVTIDTTRQVL